jgi:hypothetical protein
MKGRSLMACNNYCGTHTGYKRGGRCAACRAAAAAQTKEYRKRRAELGGQKVTVSAWPSRRHLQHFKSNGYSAETLASVLGIHEIRIRHILTGKTKRLHRHTEDRILGLAEMDLRRSRIGLIPSGPTLARLKELRDAGYSCRWIGEQVNYKGACFITAPKIRITTARKVKILHDRLWKENAVGSKVLAARLVIGKPLRSVCRCGYAVDPEVIANRENQRKIRERQKANREALSA